jgi:hypothetical protein
LGLVRFGGAGIAYGMSDAPDPHDEELLPTPDELLLELMDLVQLAFPAGLDRMTVHFVENEDGKRPALTDLDATGPVDAPARPALGHDDDRVLDAINALLAELCDATERQGGVRVHAGSIEVTTGADRDRFVLLKDAHGKEVMTRRFDDSELRWLLYTPRLFGALNDTHASESALALTAAAALKAFKRFDIDMQKGTITFSAEGATKVYAFELLGSWVGETGRFLWGWANESAPQALSRRVDSLRARSTDAGLRMFTEGSFSCPGPTAERLCGHAAVQIGASGLYKAPFVGRGNTGLGDKTSGFMMLALFEVG